MRGSVYHTWNQLRKIQFYYFASGMIRARTFRKYKKIYRFFRRFRFVTYFSCIAIKAHGIYFFLLFSIAFFVLSHFLYLLCSSSFVWETDRCSRISEFSLLLDTVVGVLSVAVQIIPAGSTRPAYAQKCVRGGGGSEKMRRENPCVTILRIKLSSSLPPIFSLR